MLATSALSALELGLKRVTTAEIIYRLPDHPSLVQSFIWQRLDVPPEFPELHKFLEFWRLNLEGRLHKVTVKYSGSPVPGIRHLSSGQELTLH